MHEGYVDNKLTINLDVFQVLMKDIIMCNLNSMLVVTVKKCEGCEMPKSLSSGEI